MLLELHHARLHPLLASVLPVHIPDTDLTVEMTGDVRADNTRRLLTALLQGASRVPTLVVIEDAHWLDGPSWEVLLEVAEIVRPLMLAVTTRPFGEPVSTEYLRLRRSARHVFRLDALGADDTIALIRQRLAVREVPATLATFILERVSGNPFFCDELLRTMIERGVVRVEHGTCVVGDLEGLQLPTTVEGVIVSRLDRLTRGQHMCLRIAAVVGRLFRYRTVRDTHPVHTERDQVAAHLSALTDAALVAPDAPAPDLSYLFRHVITRDVAYDAMTRAQRQPLHRAVAEWHERMFGQDLTPYYGLLAYHWSRAADVDKTLEYLEKAGQQALRRGAFREARLFFSQAMALDATTGTGDAVRRACWEKGAGTAHYFLGDLQTSREHLERAVAVLDRPVPVANAAVQVALVGALATQGLHRLWPQAIRVRTGTGRAALAEAVDGYKILGQIYYLNGDPAPALAYLTLRGLNVAEQVGPSPDLACILSNAGTLMGLLGRHAWADWYAARATAMAGREGHYAAGAYVWNIVALKDAQKGDWKAARAANDTAMDLVQALGDFNLEAEVCVVRATINICEGDFNAAPAAWRRARELALRSGNRQIECWSLLDEVDTRLGGGDTDGADAVMQAAFAVPTAPNDGSSTIDKHRALATTRLRQGRDDDAVRAADVVVTMVTEKPPTGYHWVDFCASAVEVYLEVLARRHATGPVSVRDMETRVRRGCAALSRLSRVFWNVRPRARLLRGGWLWHQGHHHRAMTAWRAAERIAIDMDMPFERARALLEIGRHSPTEQARAALATALSIFSALGAEHLAALTRDAAASPSE